MFQKSGGIKPQQIQCIFNLCFFCIIFYGLLVIVVNLWRLKMVNITHLINLNRNINVLKCDLDISDNGRPSFDDFNSKNITSPVDKLVTLKCTVKNKGNRTVSFIINNIISVCLFIVLNT